MQCPDCQRDSRATAKFCEHCGAPLSRRCPHCGTTLSASARFCPECGRPADASSALGGRFLSPESYTPKHLAERILTSKTALEGERKQVTVLFADVKGSMELLVDRDPEEARAILDPVLELMMEAVHRYEGTVNQVMGDGIMALFGAPLAHEDHAVRGCYAALRMQTAVKRHAAALVRSHGVPIQVRVGLNSGEVVVRAIESDLRMDYSAIGQTTHLAARMEQLAFPGSIRLTAHTLRLAEGRLQVDALGPIPIKGLPDPIEVFELVGASASRTRLQAAAAGGLTRFVGRAPELAVLERALETAGAGRGQVVAVAGEPGVGKSRLILELTRSEGARGWLILHASAASYGAATGLGPVVDLLRVHFQIEKRDRSRRFREKISGKLVALDERLLASLPAFLALLDVAFEDARWQALDPRERRRQTLDACRRLLLRESQVQPVLLVFEDLHWVDSETQALLDALVESLAGARVLLLVDYRPEYQHGWAGKTYYTQVRVDPLPAVSADELLRTLLGTDASLEPLTRLLIDRTGGNPFFLEECVKTLVETTVLAGDRGAYRAVRAPESVAVPATVRAVLAARIDRLPPDVKRLLQSAAVIGTDVPVSLLRAVAEDPDDELGRHLAHLQAAEFLYERTLFPDVEYTFNHALTQDVAYGSLLQERRRTLHAQIMTALEPRAAEHLDRLAHHALRGEVWDKAVAYLRRAGETATARSAYREAVTCFEQALGALARLPESRDTMATAIDLRLDLRTALTPLGQYRRILDLLGEAEAIAGELQDDARLGHVVADMSARLRNTGNHAGALAAGERACTIAARLHDRDLHVLAPYRLAQAHFAVGDFTRSVERLQETLAALGDGPAPPDSRLPAYLAAWPRAWLALGLSSLGSFGEAIQHGETAIRVAEAADHPHSVIEAQVALARVHLGRGDLERAIALFERGLAPSRAWNIWDSAVFSGLGYAYALAGRVADGVPLLEEAVERGQSIDAMGIAHATRLSRLGEGYLLAGRLREARARGEEARACARKQKELDNEAWALRLLGAIASQSAPPEIAVAEGHYGSALALAEQCGTRPLAAHCHLALGELYRRTDDTAKATGHTTIARTMYGEMGMRLWLERAEGGRRVIAGPRADLPTDRA
jgi:class 3 adenylate cyclase/tetratricopeptide (TPR) repeat protein